MSANPFVISELTQAQFDDLFDDMLDCYSMQDLSNILHSKFTDKALIELIDLIQELIEDTE